MSPRRVRQVVFVALAFVGIFGGLLAGKVLRQGATDTDVATQSPPSDKPVTPWYLNQPQPPSFLTKDENGLPRFEEELPQEAYVPDVSTPTIVSPPSRPITAPWRKFAVAVPDPGGRPVVAILIDDMGVDQGRSLRMAALPGPLTLSYLPYSRALVAQSSAARAAGHELMVHVSMEPSGQIVDPGPNVLRLTDTVEALRAKLDWALGQFDGYVGLNNHMGSRFSADDAAMRVVLSEISRRGLLFVDSRTTSKTVGATVARELGVPHLQRNLFLDNVNTQTAVTQQLAKLEEMAVENGFALAIGHPREGTLRALEPWLRQLTAKGIALVPVSYLVARAQTTAAAGR